MLVKSKDFEGLIGYIVLELEGGYVNHKDDSGGRTKYGVSEKIARACGYTGGMHDLTFHEAKRIYKQEFWEKIKGRELCAIDWRIALFILDFSINSGVPTAVEKLQVVLKRMDMTSPMAVDGIIGPITLSRITALSSSLRKELLEKLIVIRQDYYRECKGAEIFLPGWLNRLKKIEVVMFTS